MSLKKNTKGLLFFKEPVFKVAELLFNSPNTVFHVREITRSTKISTTAVTKAVVELHKYKIITVEKSPITTNIKANIESACYYAYKKIFNLYMLEKLKVVENLNNIYNPKTIVLFGSYAQGEDTEKSDIDLLILSNQKETKKGNIFVKFLEKTLHREVTLHIIPSLDKSSIEFNNALANGIVLSGYLHLIK